MLPLVLVVGLLGAGAADTATALGPALLLSITVTPTPASIASGQTQQFTATGHYSDLSTRVITNAVTWSSSAPGTATISNVAGSQGLATGIANGVATMTATDPATHILGVGALTVLPAVLTAITVTPTPVSIASGQTQQLTATGHYSDLSTRDLTNAVTWSSSAPGTATISNVGGSQGLATGIANGVATMTATDPATLIPGTAAVTVLPAVLTAVTVSPAVASIASGHTQQFTATGHYSDLSTRDLTDVVTWSSSAPGTATISNVAGSQGLATGIADGVATMTATDPATLIPGTAAVTVLPLPAVLVAITVSPPLASITPDQSQQFSATGTYSDLSTRDLTSAVTWSSSAPGTATISNAAGSQGLATGIADGVATITATDPATLLSGVGELAVTPVALPPSPGPPSPGSPVLTMTPATGKRHSGVVARGANFAPGGPVTITYLSGLKAKKRASTVLCTTTVASDGTFSCGGTIPRRHRSGKKGQHTVKAVGPAGTQSSASFLLKR